MVSNSTSDFKVTSKATKKYENADVQRHAFLILSWLEASDQFQLPGRFTLRESAVGTLWIGGWFGPGARMDVEVQRKIFSYAGNRTLVVNSIA